MMAQNSRPTLSATTVSRTWLSLNETLVASPAGAQYTEYQCQSLSIQSISWKSVSSVSLFLSFDFMCFIVEKLLSQMYVLPNILIIERAKSLRSGKRDSGSSLQNEIPLSLRLAWKNGSDCSSQSSSCNSEDYSLTATARGSAKSAIRGCIAWKSWKRRLNCSCNFSMSALYL